MLERRIKATSLKPCHKYGSLGDRDRASVVDLDVLLLVLGVGSLTDDEDTTSKGKQSTPHCLSSSASSSCSLFTTLSTVDDRS